ncbi:hypothetical protein AAHA92_11821 [Salvia divinorum]|uniref:Uncharacterized protein n=1 Tax=Salvia divinorum TaxID=28513 RepID=A0ABD1HLK7_SALDI
MFSKEKVLQSHHPAAVCSSLMPAVSCQGAFDFGCAALEASLTNLFSDQTHTHMDALFIHIPFFSFTLSHLYTFLSYIVVEVFASGKGEFGCGQPVRAREHQDMPSGDCWHDSTSPAAVAFALSY